MCAKEQMLPEEAALQVMGLDDFSPEDSLEAKVQRLKHCNLGTIPKKGAQNQAP